VTYLVKAFLCEWKNERHELMVLEMECYHATCRWSKMSKGKKSPLEGHTQDETCDQERTMHFQVL